MNSNRKQRFRNFLPRHWQPQKIEPPTVDAELEDLDAATRSCEVVRFSLLSLEWWLSPNGTLRELLKLNGKITSILVVPVVLVMPLVTLIIWQVAKWMGWLVSIAGHIILFPLVALAGIVVSLVIVAILRFIFGR